MPFSLLSRQVDNFTVSFADGRALCYLVHRYHPELLPRSAIRDRTTLTYMGELDLSTSSGDDSFSGSLTRAFSPGRCSLARILVRVTVRVFATATR